MPGQSKGGASTARRATRTGPPATHSVTPNGTGVTIYRQHGKPVAALGSGQVKIGHADGVDTTSVDFIAGVVFALRVVAVAGGGVKVVAAGALGRFDGAGVAGGALGDAIED